MKKIMIGIGGHHLCLDANGNIGAILEALGTASVYRKTYSKAKQWELVGDGDASDDVEVLIVNEDNLAPATPVMESMAEEVKRTNSMWSKEYARANKAEDEVKALKAKIAAFTNPVPDGDVA